MRCEIAGRTSFNEIRYAQCWEDADILLKALDIHPGHVCLSIASAGDNTLALLSKNPARVIALDLSPAQLACLELRVAAFRTLSHPELLELLGSTMSTRRPDLYRRCRAELSPAVRRFWDERPAAIAGGIGASGKFERYLEIFRRRVLPLAHCRERVARLLLGGSRQQCRAFYEREWDTLRWRLIFRIFCSRPVVGRLGRERSFFTYAQGGLAGHLLKRVRHALTTLNPADNPYLQWILTGRHISALPYALRPENFQAIRANLDRLEWHCLSLEDYLAGCDRAIDRWNLSDIFEYMSPINYRRTLERITTACNPGARLAYWNLIVPRSRPQELASLLRPLDDLAGQLHQEDKAFFYSRFIMEEVTL
ncbi:MAG: hypothetical protein KatS3mg057_0584 [Herpetosiphonaceae bacterium]|nr:MAG: hypothetical protein KatS3mg057_0584 [Herpetosiphonaceae bacterium]